MVKIVPFQLWTIDKIQCCTHFQDNLLAIESDLEALDAESTYDKLQRQFDNSKLSDIFDYEQGEYN